MLLRAMLGPAALPESGRPRAAAYANALSTALRRNTAARR